MDMSSLKDALSGFLSHEPATLKGDSIEIAEWKTVLERIIGDLKKESQLMVRLESLLSSSLANEKLAFISCLLNNSTVKKILGEYAAKCKQQIKVGTAGRKNAATAASIGLQGNSLYLKKEYRAAFKMYTRALMFARDEDKETPLLYANRSAVYFYLNQHENTLEDIERALQFGYGRIKPTGKLLIRKGFSLLALGRDEQAKELLNANMPANENGHNRALKWQHLKEQSANVDRQITKRDITMSQFQDVSTIRTALINKDVFRPHERFPWLNAKVDLRYDAEKGFHLVSKEEMKYGEIVALSKPFVSLDPKRGSYERCHHCMVPCFELPKYFTDKPKRWNDSKISSDSLRMATPLPCPQCCNVLYCSEACRTAAWTAYHRFECSQMAILSKIDSKAHLALRMLYMFGSLEEDSPNVQMIVNNWESSADPCALMIDQQAYSFVYTNPRSMMTTFDVNLEITLTVSFLLKLVQLTPLMLEPRSTNDREYLNQANKVITLLLRHLCQSEKTVSFTNPTGNPTLTPCPILSIDGMKCMLKHSCEATVATSPALTASFGSTVKLLYATGDIPAGTMLTLDYDIENQSSLEQPIVRKYQLYLRYSFDCACTRCVRETGDTLDPSKGAYYPIACSLCGSLMIRAAGGSYRCSSTNGCNFKYSSRKMKAVYERVGKMILLKRATRVCPQETYHSMQPKVYQLKAVIESTAHLLTGDSLLLAQIYVYVVLTYLLLLFVPISPTYSGFLGVNVTSSTHTFSRDHLATVLLYANKALDILEAGQKGEGAAKTKLASELAYLLESLDKTETATFGSLRQEILPPIEQVRGRCDALMRMTAYDSMLASSLPCTESE